MSLEKEHHFQKVPAGIRDILGPLKTLISNTMAQGMLLNEWSQIPLNTSWNTSPTSIRPWKRVRVKAKTCIYPCIK